MANDDARARLAALRNGYLERLRTRLDEVRTKLDAARQEGPGSGAWEAAIDVVHRLHGTAGSYGFVAVSSELGAIERLLQDEGGGAVAWEAIDAALGHAEAAWRDAAGEGSGS